jgi:hypothetical protein
MGLGPPGFCGVGLGFCGSNENKPSKVRMKSIIFDSFPESNLSGCATLWMPENIRVRQFRTATRPAHFFRKSYAVPSVPDSIYILRSCQQVLGRCSLADTMKIEMNSIEASAQE